MRNGIAIEQLTKMTINGTEAARLENFGLKHKVGRHIDNGVIAGVMELLKLSGHAFGRRGAVGNGLEQEFRKFNPVPTQFLCNLLHKGIACQQFKQGRFCL